MERIIIKDKFGTIACNNIIIYTNKDKSEIGKSTRDSILTDWKVIKPKYYIFRDDNCLIEIWYDYKGIILDNGYNRHLKIGMIGDSWNIQDAKEITYHQAMKILSKQGKNYSNKDLMSRIEDELEDNVSEIGIDYAKDDTVDAMSYTFTLAKSGAKQNNNGGASDWYSLPKDANTLQDLIEHRNMNGSVKDIFKACYRLGIKTEDELRDANKMAYYSLREVGRITGRKDYITIAKELMGSQAIEEYCTCKECNGDCMI